MSAVTSRSSDTAADAGHGLGRFDRWLFAAVPAERLAALRILGLGYAFVFLTVRSPHYWQVYGFERDRFDPLGLLWFLHGPLSAGLMRALLLLALPLGLAAAAGWRYRITGPAFGLLFLFLADYRNSWGHIMHTEHLPVLHALVLGLTPAAATVWSLDARAARRRTAAGADSDTCPRAAGGGLLSGWPIRLLCTITVVTYLIAGVAKVRNGGFDWTAGDVLRNQIAHDNLRKVLMGDRHSPLGTWLLRYPWIFPPIALLTLVVEIGAPIALLGGRVRTWWCLAAWGFHAGVLAVMAIFFPYPLFFLAYVPFFAAERFLRSLGARARRAVPTRRTRAVG